MQLFFLCHIRYWLLDVGDPMELLLCLIIFCMGYFQQKWQMLANNKNFQHIFYVDVFYIFYAYNFSLKAYCFLYKSWNQIGCIILLLFCWIEKCLLQWALQLRFFEWTFTACSFVFWGGGSKFGNKKLSCEARRTSRLCITSELGSAIFALPQPYPQSPQSLGQYFIWIPGAKYTWISIINEWCLTL